MRILIEQHLYPYELVKDDLWDGVSADPDGNVSIDYVGYFFNERNGHCVLILPRVLLEDVDIDGVKQERAFVEHGATIVDGEEKERVTFNGFAPEEILDPEAKKDGKYLLKNEQRKFIREFAVWIYRAIDLYWRGICRDTSEDGRRKRKGIHRKLMPVMGRGSLQKNHTLLDVILALREFRKENENFFLSVLRLRQSGVNKIDWRRTVSRTTMLMTGSGPLYSAPYNRSREINFDEELFVIFYSILRHVRQYGFDALPNPGFPELPPVVFAHYLKGYGKTRLKQIKGKYFSDRTLKMWELCYAFFEHSYQIRIQARRHEYLLAKDFQIVFEAMIDELIGDKNIPEGLKEQEDGKRVDHMFSHYGLSVPNEERTSENKIYYIGDSKYYKKRTVVGDEAVYKQFTYARNVIQWNLDLFLDDQVAEGQLVHKGERKLRNDITEGYAVIPNFFISARIEDDLRYDHREVTLTEKGKKSFFARHFENRLYDRDTLIVAHYDVNFLFVLSLYAKNNALLRRAWKEEVKEKFRKEIREELLRRFDFYVMTPKSDTDPKRFFEEHFQDLAGRVYDPYGERDGFAYYSLALRKNDADVPAFKDKECKLDFAEENARIKKLLEEGFVLCKDPLSDLGVRPENVVTAQPRNENIVMPSYYFERAAKELSNGAYSITYAAAAISTFKHANAFLMAADTGVKNPEGLHTVFLFEAGADNVLKAVLQVLYSGKVSSKTDVGTYVTDGIDGAKLVSVPTGGTAEHWLWKVLKWVDV